ncbi:MAG: hypothetical protein P8J32_02805 [bacterium]|nr:hypothetical protein [bacterium]
MKLELDKIRTTPPGMDFAFCVYGEPSQEVLDWAAKWGFPKQDSGKFINFLVPKGYDLSECFETPKPHTYLDGFSPNLNKHLHIGHFANLILAKAMMGMGMAEGTVAILGDTETGEVSAHDALTAFETHCKNFNYNVGRTFLASGVHLDGETEKIMLTPGEGEYEGTMCFSFDEGKVVGLRDDGSTTYTYQDVALAHMLKDPYLIITGAEQTEHFKKIKELCGWVDHLPMGLVLNNGVKMSSRAGNVIMMQEIIDELLEEFEDIDLVYNVVAGKMLHYAPKSSKNLVKKDLLQAGSSPGLYISYAMARLVGAGCEFYPVDKFNDTALQFAFFRSKNERNPSILLKALMDHAKTIHKLYDEHPIKGNEQNRVFLGGLLEDLAFGMTKLGMFHVTKVPKREE